MDTRTLRMLSGTEIVDRGKNVTNCILPEVGIKEAAPNGSWLEAKQIQTALEARKTLVAVERIDKLGALSHAEWCDQMQLAEVTQQVGGHWQYLGHKVNGTLFLLPEEALYLIETNCLLLKHNHVTVSLQKAYSLLLNNHMPLMKYKVYASLSRVGYKVFRHDKSKLTADLKIKPVKLLKDQIAKMDIYDGNDDGNVNISANVDLAASGIANSMSSDQPMQNNYISNNNHAESSVLSLQIIPKDNITSIPGMLSDIPLLPDSNNTSKIAKELASKIPLPYGNDSIKSAETSINLPLVTDNDTSNSKSEIIAIELPVSEMASGTPLPDGKDSIKSTETSINLPLVFDNDTSNEIIAIELPVMASDTPLLNGNDSIKSAETSINLPLVSDKDTSNKKSEIIAIEQPVLEIASDTLMPDGNNSNKSAETSINRPLVSGIVRYTSNNKSKIIAIEQPVPEIASDTPIPDGNDSNKSAETSINLPPVSGILRYTSNNKSEIIAIQQPVPEIASDTPMPDGNDSNKSAKTSLNLPLVSGIVRYTAIKKSEMAPDSPLPPNDNNLNNPSEIAIELPETEISSETPFANGKDFNMSDETINLLPSSYDTSNKKSEMASDSPLPLDSNVSANLSQIAIELPLIAITSVLPLSNGNDSNKSNETMALLIPSGIDSYNNKSETASDLPLPPDSNVSTNLSEIAIELPLTKVISVTSLLDSNDSNKSDETMNKLLPSGNDASIMRSGMASDLPLLPDCNVSTNLTEIAIERPLTEIISVTPLLDGNDFNKSDETRKLVLSSVNDTSNKMSEMASDLSLPPDSNVFINLTKIAIELPLTKIISVTPLLEGNDSYKSDETMNQLLPSGNDTLNKRFEMASDLSLLPDSSVSNNLTKIAIQLPVPEIKFEVIPSIDEHGVIRLGTEEMSADIEMNDISSSNTSNLYTKKLDKRNTNSNKPRPTLNIYKVKQHQIKDRKVQSSDPKSMEDILKNIPDCYNKKVITLKVPREDCLPRNVFLNKATYVLNLKTLTMKKRSQPTTPTVRNRATHRATRNASISERASGPTPETTQYITSPITSLHQQPFNFPTSRPYQNHQRPHFPRHNFNQQQYFHRHSVPRNFNNIQRAPNQLQMNVNQRKRRQNMKNDHLQTIKDFVQRLKQYPVPPNNSLAALTGLTARFNEIYDEKIKITPNLNIIDENEEIEIIELDDDEEQIKKPRLNNEKFDKYLDEIKSLAARLKNEHKNQQSSKQKRAFNNLLKNFNKEYDTEFVLNAKGTLIDKKLVVVDSSSDSDVVVTDDEKTKQTKRSADSVIDTTRTKKRKVLRNPFYVLKNIDEGASTSQTGNKADIPENDHRELFKRFDENWLPKDDEFGSPTLCSKTDALSLLSNSQHLYDFMDYPSAYKTWVDLKLSFFAHMEAVTTFEQDLTEHSRNACVDSRLKPILVQDPSTDWTSSLEKLRFIKTNTEIEETSLSIDFDVFNRDVQNFRKTDPPKPHFRVVCVDELSKFPSGAEVRSLHSRHNDNVTIVFAVVGVGSITHLQMNPKDLPVVGND